MDKTRTDALQALNAEIRRCTRCLLHAGRANAVPGDGPVDAEIMFIGEAPGFHEDQQGIPFVGAAGQYLSELLAGIHMDRSRVYIANVIKCRPPGNRDPLDEEVTACKGYLDRQLELIQPKVVVTLGRHSMARAFPTDKISLVHGQARRIDGVIYFPMYHPAAALHRPSLKVDLEADFRRLRELLDGKWEPEDYQAPPEAEQLSLF